MLKLKIMCKGNTVRYIRDGATVNPLESFKTQNSASDPQQSFQSVNLQ